MHNSKKMLAFLLASSMIAPVLYTGNSVAAKEKTNIIQEKYGVDKPTEEQLKSLGFSEQEIYDLFNSKVNSDKIIYKGFLIDNNETAGFGGGPSIYAVGKVQLAIKAINKIWFRLPSGVRSAISKYIGFGTFLKVLNTYTGKVEDGIYWVCKKFGMPSWLAWTVTKTLMLFI